MNAATAYRVYPSLVKDEIAETRNIYIFPELKIPRTTAQYWVKKRKPGRPASVLTIESIYKRKSEHLFQELEKEKALRTLIETARRVFPYDFQKKRIKSKYVKSEVVAAVRLCSRHHKLARCLQAIGLTRSTYRRWAAEISFCKKTKSRCARRSASELTSQEIETMKKFVTSRKYAHISVSSLHLLAQRVGELFCSIDTWHKYIRCHEWKRPWLEKKQKMQKVGIRATRANEIWHVDVTVVNIRPGYKLYIQAVIDNFSRYVVAWRVTDEINAQNTVETLNLAKINAAALLKNAGSTRVMMDPGTENNNQKVLQFVSASKNLTRVLAQVDVHYSNSMIECLFRMLKNNFLYHQGIHTIEDLTRKAHFYFNQHNHFIPLAAHNGGRPAEVFVSSWNETQRAELQANRERARKARKEKNLAPACATCPATESLPAAEKFGSSGSEASPKPEAPPVVCAG